MIAAFLGVVTMMTGCSSGSAAGPTSPSYAEGAWQLSFQVVINKTQESDPFGQRSVPLLGMTMIRFETDARSLVTRSHAQSLDNTGVLWQETITADSQRFTRNWHLCRLNTLPPQETAGADVVTGLAGPEEPPATAQPNSDGTTVWRYPDGVVDVQVTQEGHDRLARTLRLFESGTDRLLVTYSDFELVSIDPAEIFSDRADDAAFMSACPDAN